MGIFDFFKKRNRYIPVSEKPMYGIRLATREVIHSRLDHSQQSGQVIYKKLKKSDSN